MPFKNNSYNDSKNTFRNEYTNRYFNSKLFVIYNLKNIEVPPFFIQQNKANFFLRCYLIFKTNLFIEKTAILIYASFILFNLYSFKIVAL